MATDPQLVRAVALIHALVTTKRGVALKQFADRRGWNLRALYRDIKALERAGFPVVHEHGWWSLPPDWLPPGAVGVSRDELVALYVARNLTPGLRRTWLGRDLASLWQKLSTRGAQTVLIPEDELPLGARATSPIDYGRHQATLDALNDALLRKRAVKIHYRAGNGAETTRTIEPGYLHLENELETLYVPSWCRLRRAVRVFAVHRILALEVLEEKVSPRAATARAALEKAFRLWYRENVVHVLIRFMPEVANEIRERRWHQSQRLVDDHEGGVYLHLDVAAPEELERWLLGYGASARVVEPVSLSDRLRAIHAEAAKVGSVATAADVRPAGTKERVPAARRGAARARGAGN